MKTQRTNNTFGNPSTRANPSVAKKVISATPQTRINSIALHIKYCATNRKNKNIDTNTKYISIQDNGFDKPTIFTYKHLYLYNIYCKLLTLIN